MTAPPWSYDAGHRRKPHVHPVQTLAGHVLTTVEPDDHPWQRGLWFAVKFVDGDNFWEELDPYGVQRHVDDRTLHWIRPDRETVAVVEHRRLGHVPLTDERYAIDWETVLMAGTATVLDRTEYTTWGGYGGLALRGAPTWSDTELTLDDGTRHPSVAGAPSRWLDITGRFGDAVAGVAVLDHPDNPRHPVPWYASTRAGPGYGDGWANFVNAAILFHRPLTLDAGERLSFRYRLVVHDGAAGPADVDEWWGHWAGR